MVTKAISRLPGSAADQRLSDNKMKKPTNKPENIAIKKQLKVIESNAKNLGTTTV